MGRKIAAIFYNTDEGRKRRKIRKKYSAEEKIRIVLIGLRGEDSIAGLCHT
jgi:transposase-like protein